MSIKRRITSLVTLLFLLMVVCAELLAGASTVRGRLIRRGPSGDYPAAGIEVSLYAVSSKIGRSPKAYSGTDGMYYIPNVPPGQYQLELWVGKQPLIYEIAVRGNEYTDIAPISVP